MKKRNYLIYFLFAIVCFSSCKKFLEENNPSNFTQNQYFTTADQALANVNQQYADLRFMTDGAGTYGESPFLLLEFPNGLNLPPEAAQSQWNGTLRTLSTSSDNNYFYVWWQGCYKAIADANLGITNIPNINMNATTKQQYLGELYFMRALHYFYLVRIFGAVPLQIKALNNPDDPDISMSRASEDSIYNQIIADLTLAEQSGLNNTDINGRTSLGAVKSLLSSVYLTMAGYPLNKGTEYYKKAADKAKEVITSGWYSLFLDYNNLHDNSLKNKGEFILQSNYLSSANINSSLCAYMAPRGKGTTKFSDEYGLLKPTPEFISTFEASDKRIQERQFFYTNYPNVNTREIVDFGTRYVYKYFDSTAANYTAQSDMNWTILRYAEVLLNFAEAENEANGGPDQAAYDALKLVRSRANLSTSTNLSQSSFRELVWKERYHELCYENKIWFDMQRTRKVLNTVNGTFQNFENFTFPASAGGATLTAKYLYFGIPTRAISNNANLLPNNTGW